MRILVAVLFLFIFACSNQYSNDQLVGTWQGAAWQDLTNNKSIDVKFDFTFQSDGRYTAHYGNQSEEGKYWIAGGNLHTVEDGKAEKRRLKSQNCRMILWFLK